MANLNRWKVSLITIILITLLYIVIGLFHLQFHDDEYSKYIQPRVHLVAKGVHSISNESKDGSRWNKQTANKLLLFWMPQHWFSDWVGKKWETSQVFEKCPVPNCVLTRQRKNIRRADAVLFRSWLLNHCQKKLKRGQVWIIFEHEPPTRLHSYKYCNRNLINWTMTYRRDSDFTLVHGHFSKKQLPYHDSAIDNILKAKTKTAVTFISHCPIPSKRLEYIKKLRKYGIDVDIYGKCGNLKCNSGLGRHGELKAVWNVTANLKMKRDCFDVLDSRYKFYLSFENSLCEDYVTEKSLHLVLPHSIVPIIRDASNHTLFHPPNSYLDTKDFKTMTSLVDHIQRLSHDFDEYKKHFYWKKYFSSESISEVLQSNLCEMCKRLHNQQQYQRLYRNILNFTFLRGNNSAICHKPTDI